MEAGPGLVYMSRAVSRRFASWLAQPAVPHLSHLCHGARSLASCRRVQRDGDLLRVSGLNHCHWRVVFFLEQPCCFF